MENPDVVRDVVRTILDCARLMGVRYQEGTDAFGRPYIHFERAGLQRMHARAIEGGHPEVAENIRQMMVRATRVDLE